MRRIDEVYAALRQVMYDQGIPDTLENRLEMLQDIRTQWQTDPTGRSVERSLYLYSIACEIVILQVRLRIFRR